MAGPYPISSLLRLRTHVLDSIQRTVITILQAGPVPRHIAFVMDGNRRYARARGIPIANGHLRGFYALARMLDTAYSLGIKHITVYAFAIDNFNRELAEVDTLMKLIEERLLDLCSEQGHVLFRSHPLPSYIGVKSVQTRGPLRKYDVRFVAIGKIELCTPGAQTALRRLEEVTKDYTHGVLSMCVSYSARDEIATAVEQAANEKLTVTDSKIKSISIADLDAHMMTARAESPPPDIFVRTSGVKRLSDFLLWQCNEDTQIQILKCCWPEIGLHDLIPILLDYQRKIWASASVGGQIPI